MNSINTNIGAMVALRNLNAINADLQTTQNRISTGLRVASAKDDGAAWAIAQQQRSTVSSLDAVKQSLSRNSSVVDVALTAGESVSDLLTQLRDRALEASDTSLDSTARSALNNDFIALRNQITKTLANAGFNGINLLNGSRSSIAALANAEGTSRMTVDAQNLSLGGAIVTLSANAALSSATAAGSLLSFLDASINNVSVALARLGTASKSLDRHQTFIGKLQDKITEGIGNLVDADLAKESARLQSLQVRQQLAIQMLSISSQSQSWVLSLFR